MPQTSHLDSRRVIRVAPLMALRAASTARPVCGGS